MRYITNDECSKTLHSFGNVLNVEKAYTICDAGCEDANHVFFENGEYHRLEEPLVLRCDRNHQASLIVKYKDGSTQQGELWLFTNCQYVYSSAYDLIEDRLAQNKGLVSVLYGMAKDFTETAETVWDKETRYQYDLQIYTGTLANISESYWAKPVLLFTYKDADGKETEEWVYCYREVDSMGISRLVKGEPYDFNEEASAWDS